MSSTPSSKSITGTPKDKPEFQVNYGFFDVPPQEHSEAPNHTADAVDEPDLGSKFAIKRDYLDKAFNEIEGDKMADENLEAMLTKLAYDERNSYVMQYLKKIQEKEIERSDSLKSSPEPQSHQLHE